jgi:hypothetical protein
LNRIKNKNLKLWLEKMINWEFVDRFTIEESLAFYFEKFEDFERERIEKAKKKIAKFVKEINPTT